MTCIPGTLQRLQHAAGLAAVLDAAYDAFEDMLQAIRACEDPASGLFAAFVMAAASAADGRDAILFAPSLPPGQGSNTPATSNEEPAGESAASIAGAAAGLSRVLAARLTEAWETAADPGDRAACADAVCCAQSIAGLLGGSGP
jgi:hypothetical protein